MKKQLMRYLMLFIVTSLLLLACSPTLPEEVETPIIDESIVEPTPEPEIVEEVIEPETRFSIQADENLQDAVSILYDDFFQGETPVFVETDADLLAIEEEPEFNRQPDVPATFLPGAIFVSQIESQDVLDFINFAISIDGQETLVSAGLLPESITLIDQAGNNVTITQPVNRLISTYGPATAMTYSVDAGDRLVAASYLGARDPQGAAAMEQIDPRFPDLMGDDFFTQQDFNIEEAVNLNPDLIVTSARTAWLDAVAEIDIPVFLFEGETPERLRDAMLLLGQIFGPHSTVQAEAWVAYYDGLFETVLEQVGDIPDEERVRVLFTGTNPLRIASGDMYQTDIIRAAGGVSVSSELTGFWNDVNLEQIVIWDPDVIIVPPYGGATVEAITESPEWQILDAVQEGRVYRMPKLVVPWDTPAPDSVLGIVWMAQLLNPGQVTLDCAEEAVYFYSTFYDFELTAEYLATICTIE